MNESGPIRISFAVSRCLPNQLWEKAPEDFVNLLRPGVPPFIPEEKGAILTFAKGHPLALQVACFHVLEAKKSGEPLTVAMQKAADEMKALVPNWEPILP